MLTIVTGILRIVGIVLLAVLLTALTLLLLVLFFPLTYRIQGRREPDGTDADGAARWDTRVQARVRWLFGILNVGYDYPEPGKLTIRVLWFPVFSLDGNALGKKSSGADRRKKTEEKPRTEADSERKKGIAGIFDKIRYTISDICDKIKKIHEKEEYYRQILLADDTKGLLQHGWMRFGRLLRAIRPRHVRADVRFGTGSPDTTGYALAVYGMACPRIGWAVNLTPDFEEKVLEGRARLSGHIVIAAVLWQLVSLALDRRLHWLLRRLKADPSEQKPVGGVQAGTGAKTQRRRKKRNQKRNRRKKGRKEQQNGIKQG